MLLTSTTLNGAVSNDSNNNITMSVGNTVIANVNSSGIFFESGKKAIYTGAILQVVQTNLTTALSWTGDTNYHTIMSANITPTSTSSKILVQCHVQLAAQNSMNNILVLNATRNGTYIVQNTSGGATNSYNAWGCYGGPSLTTGARLAMMYSMNYLDSPASTSALTYAIAAKLDQSQNTAYVGQWGLNSDAANISSLLLLEIAG
jgi:hypothetical protein